MLGSGATNTCSLKYGDANGDGTADVSDLTYSSNHLYDGGAAPPHVHAVDFDRRM